MGDVVAMYRKHPLHVLAVSSQPRTPISHIYALRIALFAVGDVNVKVAAPEEVTPRVDYQSYSSQYGSFSKAKE